MKAATPERKELSTFWQVEGGRSVRMSRRSNHSLLAPGRTNRLLMPAWTCSERQAFRGNKLLIQHVTLRFGVVCTVILHIQKYTVYWYHLIIKRCTWVLICTSAHKT